MLETLSALGFVGALVAAPLAWREWRDRREAQGLRLQADVRDAVNRRLEGESLVSVRVRPGALVEQVWLPVVARIPPDYELVVRPARRRVPARAADPEWTRAA